MELFNKGVHELTLCGLDQLSNKINIWLKDNSEKIYIQLFHSATWSTGGKIYAKDNHYHRSRFLDIVDVGYLPW